MDEELKALLEAAHDSENNLQDLEEHRILMAVANGRFSDARVTVETMRAGVTIMQATDDKTD